MVQKTSRVTIALTMMLVPNICSRASIPTIPVKAIRGKSTLSTGMETALEAKTRVPLRPGHSSPSDPEVIDLGVDQLGQESCENGAQDDPHLQREYRLPPRSRGVQNAEEKRPGRLASVVCPVGLSRQQHHQLKIESGHEIDEGRQPDGGDGCPAAQLLVNQIAPGEGQRVDETGIHNQASEICDLGGGDVSRQREEQIKAAEYYGGLSLVDPEFAFQESFRIAI